MTTLTLSLLLALAQDGGRVDWKGMRDDPKDAILEAVGQSKPIMLFFTGQDDETGQEYSGAFRDKSVVAASKRIMCILVDSSDAKNADLCKRYNVGKSSAVMFCDQLGRESARLAVRDPAALAKSINELADGWALSAEQKKLAAARERKMIQLIFFVDASPASKSVDAAFRDDVVKEILPRFNLYRVEYKQGSPQCLKYDVSRAPTILIVDPNLEKPESKPVARIAGSRNARELRRDLDEALAAMAPAKPEEPAARGSTPPPPQEKLSDDELERKFIRARVGIALEMQKQGKKDKAVEILEDVVKSYPKHVDTPAVRKMLEDLKK